MEKSIYGETNTELFQFSGNHYELGFQQGLTFSEQINFFLNDNVARLNSVFHKPVHFDDFLPQLTKYKDIIAAHLPSFSLELQGLAIGAGITFNQALFLQLRRELSGFMTMPSGDCTSFAVGVGLETTLAQTIDLNGNMRSELFLMQLNLNQLGRQRKITMVSFTGLLGYLGMNDRGLAIGLNLVLGGEWRPGIPGYMAIRHLLNSANTVDDALEILVTLPLGSSRSFTLCDTKRKVTVEYILNEHHLIEGEKLIHANHFLHQQFRDRDQLNPLASVFSRQRHAACSSELASISNSISPKQCLSILRKPPIYVCPRGDARREETVASVVMQPGTASMWLSLPDSLSVQMIQMKRSSNNENF